MTDSDSKKIIKFISALVFVLSFFVLLKMTSGVDLKFLSMQIDYLFLLAGSIVFFVLSFTVKSKWLSFAFTLFMTYCLKASVFSIMMKIFLLDEVSKIIYYSILSFLFAVVIFIFIYDFKNYNINMRPVPAVKFISVYLLALSSLVFIINFYLFIKKSDLYSGNIVLMGNVIYYAFAFFPVAVALSYYFIKNNSLSIILTSAILLHAAVSGFSSLVSNIFTVLNRMISSASSLNEVMISFQVFKIIFSLAVFITSVIFIIFLLKNLEFSRIKVFKV